MLHNICTLKCILRAHFVENAETCYPKGIPAAKGRILGKPNENNWPYQSSKLTVRNWITVHEG